MLVYPGTKNEACGPITCREHSGRKFLILVWLECRPKVVTAGYIWYIPLSFVAWWEVFCNKNQSPHWTADRSSPSSLQQGIRTLAVKRLVLAFVSLTMWIYEHRRPDARISVSRQGSVNIRLRSPIQPEPITIPDISSSSNTNLLFEEQPSELDSSWSSVLSEPTLRCYSPLPSLICDGRGLCDDYSVEVPCVVRHISLVARNRGTILISADCFWSMQRWPQCLGRPAWTVDDCGESKNTSQHTGLHWHLH
jgi:hypothetical protein